MTLDPSSTGHLGRGWAFPVRWTARAASGYGAQIAEGDEDVRQAILILLRTRAGERVMRPGFGADVDRFVFAPRSGETIFELQQLVERALVMGEPRIDVLAVEAYPSPENDARIDVRIEYRIDSHRRPSSLVFPFYVRAEEAAA
jgi:Bacteriophage baseplate protein W